MDRYLIKWEIPIGITANNADDAVRIAVSIFNRMTNKERIALLHLASVELDERD